jgi:hypothetical protein
VFLLPWRFKGLVLCVSATFDYTVLIYTRDGSWQRLIHEVWDSGSAEIPVCVGLFGVSSKWPLVKNFVRAS